MDNQTKKESLELLAIAGKRLKPKKKKNLRPCELKLSLPKCEVKFFYWEEVILPESPKELPVLNSTFFCQPATLNLVKHVSLVENDLLNQEIQVNLENKETICRVSYENYQQGLMMLRSTESNLLSALLMRLFKHQAALASFKTKEELDFLHFQMTRSLNTFQFLPMNEKPIHFIKTTFMSEPIGLNGQKHFPMSIRKMSFSTSLVEVLGYPIDEFKFKVLREGLPKIYSNSGLDVICKTIEARIGQSAPPQPSLVILEGTKSLIPCNLTIYTHFHINQHHQRVLELIYNYGINKTFAYRKISGQEASRSNNWTPMSAEENSLSPFSQFSPLAMMPSSCSMEEISRERKNSMEIEERPSQETSSISSEDKMKGGSSTKKVDQFLIKFYPNQYETWKKNQVKFENKEGWGLKGADFRLPYKN